MADERIPVILDTDIGSDIDDAVALAYLLRQPRCELVGITTVSGQPLERARLASAICRAEGRDEVPILAGAEASLLRGVKQPHAAQIEILPRWPHRADFEPNAAVEWLRQTIRRRPGEITLLSIGPLTNVGLLFATDPEIAGLLKGWVSMAGRFLPGEAPGGFVEWNVICDPEAGAIAFDRGPTGARAVGLDVTLRCQLPAAEVRERFTRAGGSLLTVLDAAEVWFRHANLVTFHDPLAAACIFEPELCSWRPGTVEVECAGVHTPGLTWFEGRAAEPRHEVAATVDAAAFFRHYFEIVGG
jgi:inosine-uridine nucleoside N-ribohydrolase